MTIAVLLESTLDQKGIDLLRQQIFAAHFAPAMQNDQATDTETILEISVSEIPAPLPASVPENERLPFQETTGLQLLPAAVFCRVSC